MVYVRVLGQSLIEFQKTEIRPDAELLFATLLYLCVERGRRVERDALAALLWPREGISPRRHNLRQILYKLRRLGVRTGSATDSLIIPRSEVRFDFEDGEALHESTGEHQLTAAGGVRPLAGYAPRFSKAFAGWVDSFRTHVDGAARRRLVEAIRIARRGGRWNDVEQLARNCLQIDPLNEEATLALAEAMSLAGAKSTALKLLDAYVGELGPHATSIKLPASVLRKRISDRPEERGGHFPLHTLLVGREGIIGIVTAAIDAAAAGRGSMHVLYGPPGIGKTRILEEATRLAGLKGIMTLSQKVASNETNTPGLSLIGLLRSMLAAPGALGLAPDVLALVRRVIAHDSIPSDATPVDMTEDALVRAVVDLERSLAWESPLLVVMDDIHNADHLTRRVLSRAQGCLSAERVMVLAGGAIEPADSGLADSSVHRIGRLGTDATKTLSRLLVERTRASADERTIETLAMISGGNPFFLRETVISWAKHGSATLDASTETILHKRLSALSEAGKDVLLSAVILSTHAAVGLLFKAAALPRRAFEEALVELDREHILSVESNGAVTVHSMWGQLLHRLFDTALIAARRVQIAELLESASPGGPDAAERLLASAEHFQRAGATVRAAELLARSGHALKERALAPAAYSVFNRAAQLAPASAGFDRCIYGALLSSFDADMPDEAASLLARHADRLKLSSHLLDSEKAEVDVTSIEARHVTQTHINESRSLITLLDDDRFSPDQKWRIALIGVRWAEQNHDTDTVTAFVQRVADLDANSPIAQAISPRIAIVHAIATRAIARACELADDLLAKDTDSRYSREGYRRFVNLRIPFWFDCNFSRVGELVQIARDAFHSYPSSFAGLRTEDIYATHAIEMMDLDTASDAIAAASRRIEQFDYSMLQHSFAELRDRLSVARGCSDLNDSGQVIVARPPAGGDARLRVHPLCNMVISAARSGDRSSLSTVVPELADHWQLLQKGCPFDYPCIALGIGLRALDRPTESNRVIAEYFQHVRVARNPPSPFIAALIRKFELTIPTQ